MEIKNKKANYDYFIEESIECGLQLEGTEVKSVKAGNISFADSFAEIINNEVWVRNFHISEYSYSSVFNLIQTEKRNCFFIESR